MNTIKNLHDLNKKMSHLDLSVCYDREIRSHISRDELTMEGDHNDHR
jgi:hypothetical protein